MVDGRGVVLTVIQLPVHTLEERFPSMTITCSVVHLLSKEMELIICCGACTGRVYEMAVLKEFVPRSSPLSVVMATTEME